MGKKFLIGRKIRVRLNFIASCPIRDSEIYLIDMKKYEEIFLTLPEDKNAGIT